MKRKICRLFAILLAVAIVSAVIPLTTITASALTTRTSAPATTNRYYVHTSYGGLNECILINSSTGECIPNCVGYAWGRAYEFLGTRPNLSKNNANTFYNYNKNGGYYSYGSTPKAASIACWDDGTYGHVAFVESVSGDNVTFTESSYGGTRWAMKTKTTAQMRSYVGTLQGYIYLVNHVHSYGAWQTVTAATCTTAGSSKRVCSCGDMQTRTDAALGHSWNSGAIITEAGCTNAGVKQYTCTKCSATKTEALSATGHSIVVDEAVPATCTETGLTEGSHCSKCNAIITTQQLVPALGHDYQIESVERGCDYVSAVYKCTRCDNTKNEEENDYILSEWSEEYPVNADESTIESKTQYSYSDKSTIESDKSELNGWTRDDTLTKWSDYGAWSSWQNSSVSSSDYRKVETKTIPAVTHQEYNYSRYLNSSAGIVGPWAGTWSGVYCGTYEERGWGVKLNNPDTSQGFAIYQDSRGGWFNEVSRTVTDTPAYTQYRYCDRHKIYSFYNWSEYSDWSDDEYTESETRQVKSRAVYRYKTTPLGHTPSDWIIDKEAQIDVAGSKHKECTTCHTILETDVIPPLENPVNPPDENAPQIIIESKKVRAGNTVDVNITLKNNPGIASMKMKVAFDSDLTLTGVAYNDAIGGSSQQPQNLNSPVVLNWYNGAANSNGDFVFATLTFNVADDAVVGNKSITATYDPDDLYNIDEDNIEFAVVAGNIEVISYIPGDINDDGKVNNKDLTRLFQYLSEWDVEVNEHALDVNGDGKVNNKDLTRLFQYLSEWDVQIF